MKKLFPLLMFLSFMATAAVAQGGWHLGIKGGANLTKVNGPGFQNDYVLNYHLGGYLELGLSGNFSIQPEFIFQSIGSTHSGNKIKLNYLSIPLLTNIKLSPGFWIQLGPQYSILTKSNQNFKNGDFSVVGGLWFQLPVGVNFSARYIVGLSNINGGHNNGNWENRSIQLGIGYQLF